MAKILVVYFSRTGYTRKVAEEIASRCGADLEAIEDLRSRAGLFGYLRSGREALRKQPADIRPAARNPSDYDLVVLGTPVWAGHVSSPMRAYLAAHGSALEQVAFFCTLGGSGAEAAFADMADLGRREPLASLALNDRELKRGGYADKLDRFLAVLAPPQAA